MSETQIEAISVKLKNDEILTITKASITMVGATSSASKNLSCRINGIDTEAGYDFVLSALGWTVENVT